MKLQLAGLAALTMVAGGFLGSPATAADGTVEVTPADIGTSWFPADTRPPGTGAFEDGPATPPLGTGSFELQTWTNPEKVQLLTNEYDGVRLADIDGIGYSTYRDSESTGFVAGVAALNIRVDTSGDGEPDAYMVYEPYQDQGNDAVLTDVWQDWDAYRGGEATWWLNTGDGGCGQANDCSWADIVAAFPDATIEEGTSCGPKNAVAPCPGSLGLNQGSYNSGIVSNADALYVSVNENLTTYDFELQPDSDGDGIKDPNDNCDHVANDDQADLDGDGEGDACDSDVDGDGTANEDDAFPDDPTETTDSDQDGTGDNADNCLTTPNPQQNDFDGDGDGDACDADDDNDGVADEDDAFPFNPSETSDKDGDGIGDNEDADDDNDGVPDTTDTDSKDDCKDGGWALHTQEFKNQGECVASYAKA